MLYTLLYLLYLIPSFAINKQTNFCIKCKYFKKMWTRRKII